MATEFEIGQFALGIAETAIGAALGFGLGLVGFHYQQKRQKEAEEEEQDNAVWDALNRLLYATSLNIETLANIKIQSVNNLAPEAHKMTITLSSLPDRDSRNKPLEVEKITELSRELDYFYKTIPTLSIMELPEYKEYSKVIHKMPGLTTFIHRARTSIDDLNKQIIDRNRIVDAYVADFIDREDSFGSRVNFIYYNKMLNDWANSICITVDDSLAFHQLVIDQLHFYMRKHKKGRPSFEFTLLDSVKEQMPSSMLFPALRSQVVEFQD